MPIKRLDLKETTQYTLAEYETVLVASDPAKVASQIGEIVIDTGGTPNNPQLYIANVAGFLNPVGGGNGSPGGLNTEIQFNNGGIFGGISGVTSNGTTLNTSNANIKITGGSSGQFLTTDGLGNLSWANTGGGGGTFFPITARSGIVRVYLSTATGFTVVSRSGSVVVPVV